MYRRLKRMSYGQRVCLYCKCSFNWDDPMSDYYPTREHMQPRSRGGKHRRGNVKLACRRCNQEKGDMTVSEYMEFLNVTGDLNGRVQRMLRWKEYCSQRGRVACGFGA